MDLDYGPSLTPELVDELERAARWIGLPLRELELIGQSELHARSFVESVERGEHERFLDRVDWETLQAMLYDARTPFPANVLDAPVSQARVAQ